MTDSMPHDPPPLPVRRRDVAHRVLRIAEIAHEIAAGTYSVPAAEVADAMLDAARLRNRASGRR